MATTKKSGTRNTKKTSKKTSSKKTKSPAKRQSLLAKVRRPRVNSATLKGYLVPFTAALALVAISLTWYYKIYTDPQRIFWGMVENNLSTKGFSKVSDQSSGQFESSETTQVSFQPEVGVINVREITDNTQQEPTRIKLQAIGTPNVDYQRYLLIDRPAAEGKDKPNYSRVYNMWLKSEGQAAQLINGNLFGPLLFGDLPETVRQPVMQDLRKAYDVNYSSVRKVNLDGRRTYAFDTEIALADYAAAAQKYAQALGLAIADQINPKSYSPDDKTRVTLYVDALSRQVRKVEYQSAGNFENYTGYGITKEIEAPKKTVTTEEFQRAINSVSEN